AAVSLSWGGPGAFPHRYAAGKRQFEQEFGVAVTETAHALREPDWLARNPRARADDLMAAFADPNVDGIIATIGGDDSIRLLAARVFISIRLTAQRRRRRKMGCRYWSRFQRFWTQRMTAP
ncbi:MAG: LD-carboxypeptidase, partial [Spirochaetaceae bacterium]|nr:LD-carboxypeptidase [Spirochaetaceae bacterium]